MKIKTSLSFNKKLHSKLKQVAKKEGRSVSSIVEITLDGIFGQNKRGSQKAPCGNSRYSKAKIIQGLNKEEKTGSKNRNGKHLKKPKNQ